MLGQFQKHVRVAPAPAPGNDNAPPIKHLHSEPLRKSKVGRPAHVPSDESRRLVTMAVSMGLEQARVATLVGVSIPTLRKRYKWELETAVDRTNVSMGMAAYDKGMAGDTSMQKFWLLHRAGWGRQSTQPQEPAKQSRHYEFDMLDAAEFGDGPLGHALRTPQHRSGEVEEWRSDQ